MCDTQGLPHFPTKVDGVMSSVTSSFGKVTNYSESNQYLLFLNELFFLNASAHRLIEIPLIITEIKHNILSSKHDRFLLKLLTELLVFFLLLFKSLEFHIWNAYK